MKLTTSDRLFIGGIIIIWSLIAGLYVEKAERMAALERADRIIKNNAIIGTLAVTNGPCRASGINATRLSVGSSRNFFSDIPRGSIIKEPV